MTRVAFPFWAIIFIGVFWIGHEYYMLHKYGPRNHTEVHEHFNPSAKAMETMRSRGEKLRVSK